MSLPDLGRFLKPVKKPDAEESRSDVLASNVSSAASRPVRQADVSQNEAGPSARHAAQNPKESSPETYGAGSAFIPWETQPVQEPSETAPAPKMRERAAREVKESETPSVPNEHVSAGQPVVRTDPGLEKLPQKIRALPALKKGSIKDALMEIGVKETHIRLALDRQAVTQEDLPAIMRDLGLVGPEKIAQAMALEYGLPYFPPELVRLIDIALLASHRVTEHPFATPNYVPLTLTEEAGGHKTLWFAVYRDADSSIARNVAIGNGFSARFVVASEESIQGIYRSHFARTEREIDQALSKPPEDDVHFFRPLFDALLRHASYSKSSDIHILPSAGAGTIMLRQDGVKTPFRVLPKEYIERMTRILMHDNSIADLSVPKEASLKHVPADLAERYSFRLEMAQTVYGQSAVIRILDRQGNITDLEQIGFDEATLHLLKKRINTASGLMLVTGPTGSGKTTTLYAMLKQIDPVERSIQTIENPVEYRCGLWNQHEIRNTATVEQEGEEWGKILKGILRNDPDVILCGEVRDEDTAETAVNASNTGHLVFSTLHTNNAPSAIARMLNFGVDRDLLSSVLLGILAQRLVRVLCPHCKTPDHRTQTRKELEGLNHLRNSKEFILYQAGEGCPACKGTGYQGRQIIYEFLDGSEKVRSMVSRGASTSEITSTIPEHQRMWGFGATLVARGITSMDELERVALKDA